MKRVFEKTDISLKFGDDKIKINAPFGKYEVSTSMDIIKGSLLQLESLEKKQGITPALKSDMDALREILASGSEINATGYFETMQKNKYAISKRRAIELIKADGRWVDPK